MDVFHLTFDYLIILSYVVHGLARLRSRAILVIVLFVVFIKRRSTRRRRARATLLGHSNASTDIPLSIPYD